MTLGDENTDIELNEADVQGLVKNSVGTLTLDDATQITGDLTDTSGNTVYSQSNNWVPQARVEQGSNSGLNADQVDGFEASELRVPNNILQLTTTNTSIDINQSSWTSIPWDTQIDADAAYSHSTSTNNETITFDQAGDYRITVSLSYDVANPDVNPGIKFNINGTRLDTFGLTGYTSNTNGNTEGSNTVSRIVTVSQNDTLEVQSIQQGNAGTVTLRASESILMVEQLSNTTSVSTDADTLDGIDSTGFVQTDGSTSMTGTLQINRATSENFLQLQETGTNDVLRVKADSNDDYQFAVFDSSAATETSALTLDPNTGDTTIDQALTVTGQSNFDSTVFVNSGSNYSSQLSVTTGSIALDDGSKQFFGTNDDFSLRYESASDELVLLDETNTVELLRQPKSGPTQFLQGIDAGSIAAPSDSFTQIIDESVTSSPSAGTRVGYTFALDNQNFLNVEGEADGSGGIQNSFVNIPNSDLRLSTGQSIEDGSGTGRLQVNSSFTSMKDEAGTDKFIALGGVGARIDAYSGAPVFILDQEGGFDAVKYLTSASAPGTLELTNSKLELYTTTSDPTASAGQMWYRSDLD